LRLHLAQYPVDLAEEIGQQLGCVHKFIGNALIGDVPVLVVIR
jgi:hypothetical protein